MNIYNREIDTTTKIFLNAIDKVKNNYWCIRYLKRLRFYYF